ncbi:hypothetical protein ATETN484_0005079200 [Aspergillus terreus]|nr:hypothetical protein ATETN484_0005079200 [Aspergillus terreus]
MSTQNATILVSEQVNAANLKLQGQPKQLNEARAIDIVAVHGLTPWVSDADSFFWLRDFISKDVLGARVFTFNYDVKTVWFCGGPLKNFQEISRALLVEIATIREQVPVTRPLVFICHGFGGFIVESCLNNAFAHQPPFPDILDCTRGIIFLSTPQRASDDLPWEALLTRCAVDSIPPWLTRAELSELESLVWARRNADILSSICRSFRASMKRRMKESETGKVKLLFCYEENPMPLRQGPTLTKYSAALGLGGEKALLMAGCSHLSMASFINREDANYKAIVTAIKKIRKQARSDTAPVPNVDAFESGLDSNAQDIHHPWAGEVSQATTVHAVPSTLIVGRHYVNLQSAVPATIDAPEITAFPPMPLRAMGIRDLSHGRTSDIFSSPFR